MNKPSPGALAYFEQLVAYHNDPANGPEFSDPPRPECVEFVAEIQTALLEMQAIFSDWANSQ
jgi:hypothetical protein